MTAHPIDAPFGYGTLALMNWVIAVVIFVVIGYILDREIYFYEGVHFGPRLQAWLYDRWSKKYDEGKRASQLCDGEMLARPLLGALSNVPEPLEQATSKLRGRVQPVTEQRIVLN